MPEEERMSPLAAFAARPSAPQHVATAPLASVAPTQLAPQPEDADRLRLAALFAHLVDHHHAYVRRVLPYILALLAKMAGFFGRRYEKMIALCDAGERLGDALEAYLEHEERELFPMLLEPDPPLDALRSALGRMLWHHRALEQLLGRVRSLTDGYEAPIWAGRSYEVLLEELEALDENVMEHKHLAGHVLVPRICASLRGPC